VHKVINISESIGIYFAELSKRQVAVSISVF